MVRHDQQSCDERSMNHKMFSFFSVATVSKSRQYRHWKRLPVACNSFQGFPFGRLSISTGVCEEFWGYRIFGKKKKWPKAIEKSTSLFFIYFDVVFFFVYFIDVWTNGSFEWRTKTHLETFTIYRHIIVSMKLGLWRVWKNTKWFQKNMSCFYFDEHDLATLILIFIICIMCLICLISLWVYFGFLLQPGEPTCPEGISSFVTRGNTRALGACRQGLPGISWWQSRRAGEVWMILSFFTFFFRWAAYLYFTSSQNISLSQRGYETRKLIFRRFLILPAAICSELHWVRVLFDIYKYNKYIWQFICDMVWNDLFPAQDLAFHACQLV